MKNITLAVDDEILDRAQRVAARKRTTINAMVQEFLSEIAGREEKLAEARRQLLQRGHVERPHGAGLEIRPRGNS